MHNKKAKGSPEGVWGMTYRISGRWNLAESHIEAEFIEADSAVEALAEWFASDSDMIEQGLEMDNLVLSITKQ